MSYLMSEEKDKLIAPLISRAVELVKHYTKGYVFDDPIASRPTLIQSGSHCLDTLLEGGVSPGSMIELYGEEASGKSLLALVIARSFIGQGKKVIYWDADSKLNTKTVQALGDMGELLVHFGTEPMFDLYEQMKPDLLIVDCTTFLWANGQDKSVAISEIRKRLPNTTIILVSQIRYHMGKGIVSDSGFAAKHLCDIRIRLLKINESTSDELVRFDIKAKLVKNRFGDTFKTTFIPFSTTPNIRIRNDIELLRLALKHGFISKSDNWYDVDGIRFNGREQAALELSKHPDIIKKVLEKSQR